MRSSESDAQELEEWCESLHSLVANSGAERAHQILDVLTSLARDPSIGWEPSYGTPYTNTIPLQRQQVFPGNITIEERLAAIMRWNALAMVVRANRAAGELGGHIASYASAADLFEVGFNHFFRARTDGFDGDLVFYQPHSAPGIYARAFLEGRLSERDLQHFRQELTAQNEGAQGLCSYPHPWVMPDFWQFPTGSMGIGPIGSIYHARFMRYLQHRELLDTDGRTVWGIFGDGEMDEPESMSALSLAAREGLDNLIWVVNCNLQRLDGPVRGNNRIIDELETQFSGAGWNVIKLLWGSDWDGLFAMDESGALTRAFAETVDGQFQTFAAKDGSFNRQHFFGRNDALSKLVSGLTDKQIDRLKRGGHDPVKIYAAYHAATQVTDRPTVILAQTKKGYGMGEAGQGKMTTHQQKKLDREALLGFRDHFGLPLSNEEAETLSFYKPSEDSPEMRYLHDRRKTLGGYMPTRLSSGKRLSMPRLSEYAKFAVEANGKEMSTTMAFIRMISGMLKHQTFGSRVVPIVADEARTFGMANLFRQIGIYSNVGQRYEPEDIGSILSYREAKDGQIIEDGITEAGAMSSWIAASTSYSVHDFPMVPFYIFYSMFGFQRVGDFIWAAGDQRARGFLMGATAGRTTLGGEGLQHQDGQSHLVASTIPNCRAYDPAFAGELAVILDHGMRSMFEKDEDVFYYITVMNENYAQPSLKANVQEDIVRGMYHLETQRASNPKAIIRLLGSGAIMPEVQAAAVMLANEWGVDAEVWSVTSYTELARDAHKAERHNRLHPTDSPQLSHISICLDGDAPVVAATDYVRALPNLVAAYIEPPVTVLGTDGYGRSDTRQTLREFFEVSREHIVLAALSRLVWQGHIDARIGEEAISKYRLDVDLPAPWEV